MADVITRLKVESKDYDAQISRATDGILKLEEACRKNGSSLNSLSNEQIKFIESLGDMQTKATKTRSGLRELNSSYVELRMQYNRLTDDEKNGAFGTALSSSLSKLSVRIQETKAQISDISGELGGGASSAGSASSSSGGLSGALEAVAGKFGLNITSLTGWGAALGAAGAALKLAKDAFSSNEQMVDAWGRTVQSAESVYKGFLNALNSGDIGSFLSNMSSIVSAARDAYNAMDELQTFNAFNQVNTEASRTALNESIADYREGTGSKDAVKAAGDAFKKELSARRDLENEAYLAAIRDLANQRGISEQDLKDALSGSYGDYKKLKELQPSKKNESVMLTGPGSMPIVHTTYTAANDQERLAQALRRLNDTELEAIQKLGAQANRTGNEIAQVDKQVSRILRGNGGSSGSVTSKPSSSPSQDVAKELSLQQQIAELEKEAYTATDARRAEISATVRQLDNELEIQKSIRDEIHGIVRETEMATGISGVSQNSVVSYQQMLRDLLGNAEYGSDRYNSLYSNLIDAQTFGNLMQRAMQDGIDLAASGIDSEEIWETILSGDDIPDSLWSDLQEKINEKLSEMDLNPLSIDVKTGSVNSDNSANVSEDKSPGKTSDKAIQSMASGIGGIMSGINQLGIKLPEGLNRVVGILQGISTILTAIQTLVGFSSIFPFNRGGIVPHAAGGMFVPGSSYSGDLVPAALNSGELVLNRAQQGVLASELSRSVDEGSYMQPFVSGEDIFLGMNNTARRKGLGEIVTTGMLRKIGIL